MLPSLLPFPRQEMLRQLAFGHYMTTFNGAAPKSKEGSSSFDRIELKIKGKIQSGLLKKVITNIIHSADATISSLVAGIVVRYA